jgi:photosystem II stability/assembly factor-like uncharacterized protein
MKRPLFVLLASVLGLLALATPSANASPGWEIVLDRPTPNFGGIDFVSADEGWMTAGAGLLHTTDGGGSWTEAARLSVNDVDFFDAAHGWAAGNDGAIFYTADGGETWEEQSVNTIHLQDVEAISATEAWAVGYGEGYSDVILPNPPSTFLHTTDGGATWQTVETPALSYFYQIEFVGQSGWAMGYWCEPPTNGPYCAFDAPVESILRTTNGGATWTLLPDVPVRTELTFLSETEGWALGELPDPPRYSAVYHTTDGGMTWQSQFSGSESEPFSHLAFKDATRGWVASSRFSLGDSSIVIRRTTDGGATWQEVSEIDATPYQYPRNFSMEVSTLYLIGGGDLALRSHDGGDTWDGMATDAISISTPDFVSKDEGFTIVGNFLYRTIDAGAEWFPVRPLPEITNAIEFIDDQTGLAIAGDCCADPPLLTVHRTDNGGLSWRQVYRTTALSYPYVLALEFLDADHGLAALQNGTLMTSDGGDTWQEHALPNGQYVVDGDLAAAGDAWAIVTTGQFGGPPFELSHTEDGGQTWTPAPQTPSGSIQDVVFVDAGHGFYLGGTCNVTCTDTLYATNDGGATWAVRSNELAETVHDLVFTDRLNGWISSQGCFCADSTTNVLHTADGGRTWASQLTGEFFTDDELFLGTFDFLDAQNGWLLLDPFRGYGIGGGPGHRTVLYHTPDGGGGPIGIEPTPTFSFPDVGARVAGSNGPWPYALALAALGTSLALAGAMAARRRGRE